jgi:hypothetical protein
MKELNQGQKAKITKFRNKIDAEYDAALQPFRDEHYGFCETLYPARDSEIARAEKIMNDIIARAREDFRIDKEIIMNKFESNPEVIRTSQRLEEERAKQFKILQSKLDAFYKEMGIQE